MKSEQELARYLREQGAFTGSENTVPGPVLQALWQDPRWTSAQEDGSRLWSDGTVQALAARLVACGNSLGYIYTNSGRIERAKEAYNRVLLLEPNNAQAAQDLKALQSP